MSCHRLHREVRRMPKQWNDWGQDIGLDFFSENAVCDADAGTYFWSTKCSSGNKQLKRTYRRRYGNREERIGAARCYPEQCSSIEGCFQDWLSTTVTDFIIPLHHHRHELSDHQLTVCRTLC